jgi:hypothetical protein
LLASQWSTPGGDANGVDTVENVFVQSPEQGQWRIDVIAHELDQDNHVETPQLDADFALVVSGHLSTGPGFDLAADTSGGGTRDLNLALTGIPAGTTHGFTLVSLATVFPLGAGPVAGIMPDATTFAVLGLPASAGNQLHWTHPVSAPLFPAGSISVGAGGAPWVLGTVVDFAGVALTPAWLITGISNVERLTF